MSKGFNMLRDYIEHDALCMRRRKCCDFEYELQQEFAELQKQNEELRKLCAGMWEIIADFDGTPYIKERHGNNPAVTWLDPDWEPIEDCKTRMRELGIGVSE